MSEESNNKYFYQEFKIQRKSKNISINEIEKTTKINQKYIEAIEAGNFNILPKTYIKLFIKSYAKFIGLNVKKVLKSYDDFKKGKLNIIGNNKTPYFIKEKSPIKNHYYDSNEFSNNSYYFNIKNLFVLILSIIFIIISWSVIANIFEKKSSMHLELLNWNQSKLDWELDFNNLQLIDSDTFNLDNISSKNMIKYQTSEYPNKIIITDRLGINLVNKILDKNSVSKNECIGKIKFGILHGEIILFINNQEILINNKNYKIIGYLDPNKKNKHLLIQYFK